MKKILFPCTSSIHYQRNQLLLEKLKENFEVHIAEYSQKEMSMSEIAVDITPKFKVALDKIKPDAVIIRADRAELLPCTALSVYGGYKVIQLEAGDRSGTWDNKIRYAISALADVHFTTNSESQQRMLSMGYTNVYNCGSLDVEYALQVAKTAPEQTKPYVMCLYHPIPNEDATEVFKALEGFDVVGIRSNKDYGQQTYTERYSPEEFINLLRDASCIVGNSSCLIKEAGILGTPAVLVGERQHNRTLTKNIIKTECDKREVEQAIKYSIEHGNYGGDLTYYKPDCSKRISDIITSLVG